MGHIYASVMLQKPPVNSHAVSYGYIHRGIITITYKREHFIDTQVPQCVYFAGIGRFQRVTAVPEQAVEQIAHFDYLLFPYHLARQTALADHPACFLQHDCPQSKAIAPVIIQLFV